MSRGRTLLDIGWDHLLDEHGLDATYTPAVGAPSALVVLDNGTPEDIAQLAMGVDGISRIVTLTRGTVTPAVNDTVTIAAVAYKVIAIRPRSDQALDLLLGASNIAGRQ